MIDAHPDPWAGRYRPAPEALPHIASLARLLGRAVSILDIESNRRAPAFKGFRIIELGLLRVAPDGALATAGGLVSPDGHSIEPEIQALTGITPAQVAGQPGWEHWAEMLHELAAKQVTAGFFSRTFDVPAIVKLNGRKGRPGTVFRRHLDIRGLGGKGSLTARAAARGIPAPRAHRALDDAWTAARLLESYLAELGRGPILAAIGPCPEEG